MSFKSPSVAAPPRPAPTGPSAKAPTAESAPTKALRRLIAGYQTTFLVKAAAELQLADRLADGPRSVDELARTTGSKPGPLRRVLFALGQIGVLLRTADGRFGLTPLGACLRADHPDGLAAFARYQGDAIIQRPWASLLHSARTGETAFDTLFGASLFDYLATHPDAAALFTAGMAARTAEYLQAIVTAYDWSGFGTIVDIGGADGTLLSSILATAANTRGVIFDRPRVQAAAEQRVAAAGLRGRCSFGGGDFFAAVPPGGDAYLLKYILHDWDDTAVVTILRNVHRAAPAHARLLVIEPLRRTETSPRSRRR
jgi:O-methyltransferase domain